ncbi:hypothetical protein D7W79_24235 [Corallococcus exercitus]|uniref:J domain-containing protein n=1 Tax=Corallococcus exercitus TaxID=2316736 RepID=UPI000EA32B6F|nr:DnaJ domain-containing protein [Corallococcus exercitus]RKG73953.1 hypothetical protein D7W79_24235 [Corallococcus exercitus]
MQAAQRGAPNSDDEFDVRHLVKQLSTGEVLNFISAPCCLIKLGPGACSDDFHYAITARLGLFHHPRVRLGVVDSSKVEWTVWVKAVVKAKLQNLAVPLSDEGHPPAGYYLFIRGAPVAFHPAAVDLDQDGSLLLAGAATAFAGFFLKSPEVVKIATHMGVWAAGDRAAAFFVEQIKQLFSESASAAEETLPVDENDRDEPLRMAYELLGLSLDASETEVRSAYRNRVMECHPDRAGRNPVAQERANRRTAEVNAARDYIWRVKGYR